MLDRLKKLLLADVQETPVDHHRRVQRAATALLIEVARSDFKADATELDSVRETLANTFDLDRHELAELIDDVCQEVELAGSLHPYTSLIHDSWSYEQKIELMQALWRVAFADGRIDRYEEHMLRRIADLLYLRHQDFIRSKHAVEPDGRL